MNKSEIVVIDDEASLRKLLEITLQTNDYKVRSAATAKEGIQLVRAFNPDLVLLDLGLPDISGQEVLKTLREWYHKPIIILSVQSSEEEIVNALDNGANDYLIKPFRSGELLARIRTSLRGSLVRPAPIFKKTGLLIDLQQRQVKKDNILIKLTATEYELLVLFYKNSGRVLTHQFLLREIWGISYLDQTQYLRVFIAQLRKKIETEPNDPVYILTESGVGYRFVEDEEEIQSDEMN